MKTSEACKSFKTTTRAQLAASVELALGDAFPYAPPFEKLASLTEMIAWAIKIILNVTKITAFTTETIDSLAELIA